MLVVSSVIGCRQDMHDQPKYQPFEASPFFADGQALRTPVEGTVARGHLEEDQHFFAGIVDGKKAESYPFLLTIEDLKRGRERYDIFCSPCHDRVGTGDGMIVQRGFKSPPSLHSSRLITSNPGYLFDVISNGFGTMYSYRERIPTRDRWTIVAYIQALQMSQSMDIRRLTEEDRKRLAEIK